MAADSIGNRWMIGVGNGIGLVKVPVALLRPGPADSSTNSNNIDNKDL